MLVVRHKRDARNQSLYYALPYKRLDPQLLVLACDKMRFDESARQSF